MPTPDPLPNSPSKRRACDECRSRKIACSKEPAGCSRCVLERITCNYSEQKPMGRPRKRQFTGETKDSTKDFDSVLLGFKPLQQYHGYLPVDSYLDANAVYSPNDLKGQFPIQFDQSQENRVSTVDDGQSIFRFSSNELKRPIDFRMDGVGIGEHPIPIDAVAAEVPLGSHKHNIFDCPHPSASTPGPPCGCLASMYLSMASLQEFPSGVETALSTVRAAANTAQASVRCEKCGAGAAVELRPTVESFQNTMLLGTILPIIANGYKRLLVMVDSETATAKAAGLRKVFRITAYGGIYGSQGFCKNLEHLEEAIMDPDEWRCAVRSLLRADVYGWGIKSASLRGIIAEMEQRQRKCHKLLDPVVDNEPPDWIGPTHRTQDKDILCLRIVDAAKVAINALVIP